MTDEHWDSIALCKNSVPVEYFFDEYEASEAVAKITDQVCLSCVVQKQCFQAGVEGKETGCWGGIYLKNGEIDPKQNDHKTEGIWAQIWEKIE